MMLVLLAALTSVWNIQDPVWTALGVDPASWSRSPVSCMAAPAGLSRLESPCIETAIGLRNGGRNWSAAGGMPLGEGRFSAGAGAGWEGDIERGTVQVSAAYVVTGDPIGFMEGLFGPSISTGVTASVDYIHSTRSADVSFDCGFQFSLFPSFALGMNVSDVAGDPVLSSGFSHVFNRSLKLHLNHGDGVWQAGAELTASSSLKLYSGTDGHSLNAGFSYSTGHWTGGYGAVFLEESIVHAFGVSRRLP